MKKLFAILLAFAAISMQAAQTTNPPFLINLSGAPASQSSWNVGTLTIRSNIYGNGSGLTNVILQRSGGDSFLKIDSTYGLTGLGLNWAITIQTNGNWSITAGTNIINNLAGTKLNGVGLTNGVVSATGASLGSTGTSTNFPDLRITHATLNTNRVVSFLSESGSEIHYILPNKFAYFGGQMEVESHAAFDRNVTVGGTLVLQTTNTVPGDPGTIAAWVQIQMTNGTSFKIPLYQ
jgi:hypothetical protein